MATVYRTELQDANGNVFYPHTDAAVVFQDGKPLTQVIQSVKEQGGAVVSATAPSNTKQLWVDTTTGLLKYFDGTTWTAIAGIYT